MKISFKNSYYKLEEAFSKSEVMLKLGWILQKNNKEVLTDMSDVTHVTKQIGGPRAMNDHFRQQFRLFELSVHRKNY